MYTYQDWLLLRGFLPLLAFGVFFCWAIIAAPRQSRDRKPSDGVFIDQDQASSLHEKTSPGDWVAKVDAKQPAPSEATVARFERRAA